MVRFPLSDPVPDQVLSPVPPSSGPIRVRSLLRTNRIQTVSIYNWYRGEHLMGKAARHCRLPFYLKV
jgi:hypothetical protein